MKDRFGVHEIHRTANDDQLVVAVIQKDWGMQGFLRFSRQ